MNRIIIIAGFIVLIIGGLLYTFVPYRRTIDYETEVNEHTSGQTMITTTTGENPLGVVIMFIGFTIIVVGLFYKPEEVKTPEIKQENPE
jgi:heme/copper-type cytochrome/quinol oxidase subunit 2